MVPAAAEFYAPRLAFCAQQGCGSERFENESHECRPNSHRLRLDGARTGDARNRSGYVYFVVGPRSVLVVAGVVAVLAFWFLQAVAR